MKCQPSVGLVFLTVFFINVIEEHLRRGDDNFGVDQFLVEFGVLTLFVGCCDQSMTLILQPLPDTKLVLGCTEELWYLFGVLAALVVSIVSQVLPIASHEAWARLGFRI